MKLTNSNESYMETRCLVCHSRSLVQRPDPQTERVHCECSHCHHQWWISDPTFVKPVREFNPGYRGLI